MPMSLLATDLPQLLADEAQSAWQRIREFVAPDAAAALAEQLDEATTLQLTRVLACSPFAADLIRRKPELLLELLRGGQLQTGLEEDVFKSELSILLAQEDAELPRVLRLFRARHMLRIVWRDFCRLADTLETVRDTSLLAEACIAEALAHSQEVLEQRFGRPIGRDSGAPQQLIVLAMGKLGARELNVSSDIDLIFSYPEAGQTDSDSKPISNEQFFTKLGQALITALDQNTADGFVFRVDMRLRPYGDSGALAQNFAALEEYYQDQGRDWERYALIKARPVTGDPVQAARLMASLGGAAQGIAAGCKTRSWRYQGSGIYRPVFPVDPRWTRPGSATAGATGRIGRVWSAGLSAYRGCQGIAGRLPVPARQRARYPGVSG
jgi:glutamate-ammonia-ligase adenylyltransferase